jgi:hypothetical protein
VTSVVTTVVFTTVCPTDPASLIVTEVCSTIFYEDCGCDSQVVPEVPMTTTLASCHACGPDGGDTVTLIVPAHEIANQFRPSVPAPTGAQNGHFGNDFTGNGPAQAAGYPQGPTGGIGYDGEHIPGVSSGATAGFVQYNAQAQDVANGPESVHGQASGSESHDNAGSVSEHAPTGSSSHGNSHGDAGSVSGHATGSVPQNNPGSVPGGTTGSTSNNVPISHVTGSGATQHRSVTALGWLQVSAILVTSLAFLSFFRA